MLTRIALLVEKYQLGVVVAILSRIWMENLKDNPNAEIPLSSTEDLDLWIFISWAIQSPTEFKTVTEMAEKQSEFRIDKCGDIDLPIPCSIVG